jgi:hypothetical protein
MGETLLAAETGDALPPGAAFGTDGNPTVDGASYLIFPRLGGIAAFELDLIRVCTSEARGSSNARGVKVGRKPRTPEHQSREMILRCGYRRRAAARHFRHLQRVAGHDLLTAGATGDDKRL